MNTSLSKKSIEPENVFREELDQLGLTVDTYALERRVVISTVESTQIVVAYADCELVEPGTYRITPIRTYTQKGIDLGGFQLKLVREKT